MIPDVVMRIDKKIGKNQNILKGVFISQYKRSSREENTILAKEGKLIPSKNVRYLEIHLFDGVLYSENKFKNYYQIIEFKTLIEHLDISKLTNKNFEDNYSTLNTKKFLERIKAIKRNNQKFYQELLKEDPPIRGNLFKDLESPQKKSVDYQSLNTKEKKTNPL